MRINYKIFWVEDDDSWLDTTKNLFEDTLEEWGFKLEVLRAKSFKGVEKVIKENGLQDFDLLLVDLRLNDDEDEQGNQVIDIIRNNEVYTDIIFYSSAIDRVHEIMKSHELEGVYTSSRTNLEIKFENIVKTTIKKLQEVNTIRGLLMAETSNLDEMMLNIIEKSFSSNISKHLEKYVSRKMLCTADENLENANKEVETLEKIKDSRIFTSAHKAKTIGEICKKRKINLNDLDSELYKGNESFYKNYYESVISPRNMYGHVKETEKDGKKILISTQAGKEEIFSEERCIDIRKILISYRNLLENIKSKLEHQNSLKK